MIQTARSALLLLLPALRCWERILQARTFTYEYTMYVCIHCLCVCIWSIQQDKVNIAQENRLFIFHQVSYWMKMQSSINVCLHNSRFALPITAQTMAPCCFCASLTLSLFHSTFTHTNVHVSHKLCLLSICRHKNKCRRKFVAILLLLLIADRLELVVFHFYEFHEIFITVLIV